MAGESQIRPSHTSPRVDGWKDIATYLGRDPRTAQRWEKEDGLPVFREGGKVFAYAADLDRWRRARVIAPPPNSSPVEAAPESPSAVPTRSKLSRRWWIWGAAVTFFGGFFVVWHFWPREAQLLSIRQLTHEGIYSPFAPLTDGNLVYFNRAIGSTQVIASIPMNGGNATPVPLPFTPAELLAISPARRSLLLFDPPQQQLWEFDLTTQALRPVAVPQGLKISEAAWDPEGRRLAISYYDALTVFDSSYPAGAIRLRLPGYVGLSGWDPRGSSLRFVTADGKTDTTRSWELRGNDRAARPRPRLSPNPFEGGGSWSSDGRFFAYHAGRSGMHRSQLWLWDAEREHSYPLTADSMEWHGPSWVPGTHTILALAGHAQAQLVTLPSPSVAAGFRPVLPAVPAHEVEYSRDGHWMAYTRYPEQALWQSRPDGTDARQLTQPEIEAHQPHWSPMVRASLLSGSRCRPTPAGESTSWIRGAGLRSSRFPMGTIRESPLGPPTAGA